MENQPGALIDFDKGGGVVPVVAVDYVSGRLLMMAYMNREAFDETVATGHACYYSRSRGRLWRKGEESGNFQVVHEIRLDCDNDTDPARGGAARRRRRLPRRLRKLFFPQARRRPVANRRRPQGRSGQVRTGLRP